MKSKDKLLMEDINAICRNFSGLDNKTKLNKFLDFFEALYPEWITIYNSRDEYTYGDMAEGIEDMLVSKIPETYTVDNFKETRDFDTRKVNLELEKMARILHISNKVAHGVKYMIGTYLTDYFLDEAAAGNDAVNSLLREVMATDGDSKIRVNDRFLDDFMKKFPFYFEADDMVKETLEAYMEVDMQREKVEEEIQAAKSRIRDVSMEVLEQQRSLSDDESFSDSFLEDYLRKLRLRIRLEKQSETEELSERDKNTLINLQSDRVALTNFISEEVLAEVESLYLKNAELFSQSEDLKTQKEDYLDRIYNSTGRDLSYEFKTINNLRRTYGLSAKDMIAFMDMDLAEAKSAYDNCMMVKDKSVYNIHEYIVRNNMKYISYGVSTDFRNRNGEDARKNIFWIDVPGYSQFAVHLVQNVLGRELENLEPIPDYEMVLQADGRREQVALLSKKSPAFRAFERKFAADGLIDRKFGFDVMTKYSPSKKEQFRKLYGILLLDMGDDISNREEWLNRLGRDINGLTDPQRKILNVKVAEDRERRKAVRHQLGVMAGLSKDLLKYVYDFDELQYTQEYRDRMNGVDTVQKRNDLKIELLFDKVLGRNKPKDKFTRRGAFSRGRFGGEEPRNNHGYRRNQNLGGKNYTRKDTKDDDEYGD